MEEQIDKQTILKYSRQINLLDKIN
jgi:hypothetical protein